MTVSRSNIFRRCWIDYCPSNAAISFLIVTIAVMAFHAGINAQAPLTDVAPPPLKLLTKHERAQLAAETEVKDRTNLALMLMSDRLAKAEELENAEQFPEMYKQLGSFHAIMDDTMTFLIRNDADNSRVLRNLKKFEIGLRAFMPRLEIVRRELPHEFEPYVKSLIKYIHDTREKAIEPFYGDTVMPNVRDHQ